MTRTCGIQRLALGAIAVAIVMGLALGSNSFAQEPPRDRGDDGRRPEPKVFEPEPKVVPPGERIREGGWRLGVTIEPADVGVGIREVVPGSAAARAGLEPRDTIITVDGYQVGQVAGRHYPLDEELQRRADAVGRVTLLVQDRRTGRLVNVAVKLDRAVRGPHEGVLHGVVEYRERMALPQGAVLRLTMQRRTFRGLETIAEETYRYLGTPPIPFEFHYPVKSVSPRETYYLNAEITHAGRRMLVSEEPYVLRLDRVPEEIRIELRRDGRTR